MSRVPLGIIAVCLGLGTTCNGPASTHCVDGNSPNPTPPYSNWATAARTIQAGVDAAVAGDEVVVTNGTYAAGGSVASDATVQVDKPILVRSVNGPLSTRIQGYQPPDVLAYGARPIRCVYLSAQAALAGFTLTNGGAWSGGAGVWCASASTVVSNCILVGNYGYNNAAGGGAYQGTLSGCAFRGNSASYGGGAFGAILNNCLLNSNIAHSFFGMESGPFGSEGGGAAECELNNCKLDGNQAVFGGGASDSTVRHCELLNNSAVENLDGWGIVGARGGGALLSTLDDCSIANNTAPVGGGATSCALNSCTLTGNLATGYADPYYGGYGGRGGGAFDCTLSGCALASNSAAPNVFDAGYGGGIANSALTNCVLVGNAAGYGGAAAGGSFPTPCMCGYAGERPATLFNCTLTNNSAATAGGAAWECSLEDCALLNNSADDVGGGAESSVLTHCILNENYAFNDGGGVSNGTLTNCTLTANVAANGGGAVNAALNNCVLASNRAYSSDGGGASFCALSNCTLSQNWAMYEGGGVSFSQLKNCIIYANLIGSDAGMDYAVNYSGCILQYCCTTPLPGFGPGNSTGNITNAPEFQDPGAGNLRLQSNSPCINAGNNAFVRWDLDLDGNPRIAGGTVDIGAYEYPWPSSRISYAWLQRYGLPTDGSADFADPDSDGMCNWQEWRCQTIPLDPLSALRQLPLTVTKTNVIVRWASVAGVNYFLERATSLAPPRTFALVATNLTGQAGTTTYVDFSAPGQGSSFYRVGVR